MAAPNTDALLSVPKRWAAAWGNSEPSEWLSLYTPNATYIDHAFQIRRSNTSILKRHWELWRTAIPDFVMKVEQIYVHDASSSSGEYNVSIRTINKGTLVKDLPTKKASGKPFSFRGSVDLLITADGLIAEVNEYYSYGFHDGKDVTEYHTLASKL